MKKTGEKINEALKLVRICATCRYFRVIQDVFAPDGVEAQSFLISSCRIHRWRRKEHYLRDITTEISVDLSNLCPDWEPLPERIGAQAIDSGISKAVGISKAKSKKVRLAVIQAWISALAGALPVELSGIGIIHPPGPTSGKFRFEPSDLEIIEY